MMPFYVLIEYIIVRIKFEIIKKIILISEKFLPFKITVNIGFYYTYH
jgi:hypothetical protein